MTRKPFSIKCSRAEIHRKTYTFPALSFEDQQLTSFSRLVIFQALFTRLQLKRRLSGCFQHLRVTPIFGHGVMVLLLIVHSLLGYRELILPTNDGHPVKRLNYAVIHGKTNEAEQSNPQVVFRGIQDRGAGSTGGGWRQPSNLGCMNRSSTLGVTRPGASKVRTRRNGSWRPRTHALSASWPIRPRSWRS
jgi:hypothetical protein